MTKRVYSVEKGWTITDDPEPVRKADAVRAPQQIYEDKEEAPIRPEQVPFKKIFNGHLIVQMEPFKKRKDAMIVTPEVAKRRSTTGRVLALAGDITDMHIGDRILYSQYAGYLLVFAGLPPMRVIGRDEVLGLMKEETPDLLSEG